MANKSRLVTYLTGSASSTATKVVDVAAGQRVTVFGVTILVPTAPGQETTFQLYFDTDGTHLPTSGTAASKTIALFAGNANEGGLREAYKDGIEAAIAGDDIWFKASATENWHVKIEYELTNA